MDIQACSVPVEQSSNCVHNSTRAKQMFTHHETYENTYVDCGNEKLSLQRKAYRWKAKHSSRLHLTFIFAEVSEKCSSGLYIPTNMPFSKGNHPGMNNLNDTVAFLWDNVVGDRTMTTYKSGVQCFKQFLLLNNIVSSVQQKTQTSNHCRHLVSDVFFTSTWI